MVLALIVPVPILLLAFGVADYGCRGDGSFDPDDAAAKPSATCKALDLPGLPNTTELIVIVGLMFAAALAWSAVSFILRRRGHVRGARISQGILVALCCVVFAYAAATADVGWTPSG